MTKAVLSSLLMGLMLVVTWQVSDRPASSIWLCAAVSRRSSHHGFPLTYFCVLLR